MFANNSIDNFDAVLCRYIDGFRKWVYDLENNFIKCMNTCINILNGPMWSKWALTQVVVFQCEVLPRLVEWT